MTAPARESARLTLDPSAVRRMVGARFPAWADLPVRPVATPGWDNLTFRLGDHLKVRVPSGPAYVPQVAKEAAWLPHLAPHLPLPVPVPLAVGEASAECPFPWSVAPWLEGEPLAHGLLDDEARFARDLAGLLRALRDAPAGGPPAGPDNFHRGGPLVVYDAEVRSAIAILGDAVDGAAARAAWDEACASAWIDAPVPLHGDIAAGNLLVREGRFAAVIDWGCCAVGDPACDLTLAWTFLSVEGRAAFRAALDDDAGTWSRARGWALWKALVVLAGGGATHPAERAPASVVAEVLADLRGG